MNFKQLRIVAESVRLNFNLTEVGKSLFTTQSGISKSLRELEDELGVEIFTRSGKRLVGLTYAGEALMNIIGQILLQRNNLYRVATQFASQKKGKLVIGTTHTQARYTIGNVIQNFMHDFPDVRLILYQGNPREISDLLVSGEVDIGIATEYLDQVPEIVAFPWYEWQHGIVVPEGHALTKRDSLTLGDLAAFPLITYHSGYTGRSHIDDAFQRAGLECDIVMTAMDADVIMTFVRMGLGLGVIASMAFDPQIDQGYKFLPAGHLFGNNVTRIGIRHGRHLRDFAYSLIERLAPHLTTAHVLEHVSGRIDGTYRQG